MNRSRRFVVSFAAIVLAGIAVLQLARLTADQGEELRTLHARHDAFARELVASRKKNADADAELADLQLQIEATRAVAAAQAATPEARLAAETSAWLAKLGALKRQLAEHPDASIPELKMLDLRGWLITSRGLEFDTEEHTRQALAKIRTAAKENFANRLAQALRKYLDSRDGVLPDSVVALAPYFDGPVEPAALDRYKMMLTGKADPTRRPGAPTILEKTAVDEEYDLRVGVNIGRMANGSGWGAVRGSFGGLGPVAWIDDYQDRLKQARADFAREHPGVSGAGLAQVAPYFNPPIDPAKLQKILAREQARGP
jgi:hypothetical protein